MLSKGKRANIYTDSKYAFLVLQAHGSIWKERCFLIANGSPIKYHQKINRLLQAVHSQEVAVIHQKGSDEISEGNRLADLAAKNAAKMDLNPILAPPVWHGSITQAPINSKRTRLGQNKGLRCPTHRLVTRGGWLFAPPSCQSMENS